MSNIPPGAICNANGGGGGGGKSSIADGYSGTDKNYTHGAISKGNNVVEKDYYGGDGGAGGAAGAEGGAGTLYVSPTATVNVNRTKLSATTHSSAQYTIIFNANGGQFSSAVESLTATLGCDLPNCIPAPTRRGYLFDGWRTAAGEEYYGTSGAKSKSSYPVVGNVTLYAQWQVDETYVDHTVTTPEEVPYSYFDNNYPTLLAEHGGDYEAAALATAANGHNKVWECFVAGISPTNETSSFVAKIEMVDGMPIVTWDPDLNTNGVVRTYKVYGKETLEGGGEWQYPTNSLHRFFKVTVEMP
ncbi:MAG: InlB B-repeat-containing protein [Kiritimatiellae bacterium]|nr:InlB B-repeat-containing protein [Kiritimatiellia bacterium]